MKLLIISVIILTMANHSKAQLPKCFVEKLAVGYDDAFIKVALYKNDTCYIIEPVFDPAKRTRYELFLTNQDKLPESYHRRIFNKDCKYLRAQNQDIVFIPMVYKCKKKKVGNKIVPVITNVSTEPLEALELPQCLIQKIATGYNYSQIRVGVYKNDTCYVVERRTWNPAKASRHEILQITSERKSPEYMQPEVYNKKCKPYKFLRNSELSYTSKIYSWEEIKSQIKSLKK